MRKGGALYYLHADHLGSTVLTTDANGVSQSNQQYAAFGSPRGGSGTLPTDHTYTGQKRDGTGLMYYRARYYDPSLGQFVSPDTIVPDPSNVLDYNRYLYGLGNPVKFSDPSGHKYDQEGAGGGGPGMLIAAAAGGTANLLGNAFAQALENYGNDMNLIESVNPSNMNVTELGIAFGSGAIGGGLSPGMSVYSAVGTNAILGSGQNIATEVYADDESWTEAIWDFDTALSGMFGALGGLIQNSVPTSVAAKEATEYGDTFMRHLGLDAATSQSQTFSQYVANTLLDEQIRAVLEGRFLIGAGIGNFTPSCNSFSECLPSIFQTNYEQAEDSVISP